MAFSDMFPSLSKSSNKPAPQPPPGKRVLPAIGVDIGSGSIRAARVSKIDDDGFAVIEAFGVAPLKSDAVEAGTIRQKTMVAAALRKVLEAVGSTSNVIIGINVPEQAVARLAVPATFKPAERLSSIRATTPQLGTALQVGEADLSLNYVRQEQLGEERMAAVLVGGVDSGRLKTLLEVCRAAGITPRAVDLSGAGTLRALVRDVPTSEEVQAIVDVGATSTSVIVREGLYIRSVRTIPGGGAQITKALSMSMKDAPDVAEMRKMRMRLPVADEAAAAPAAEAPVEQPALGFDGLVDQNADNDYQRQLAVRTAAEKALAEAVDLLVDQIASTIESDAAAMGVATPHVALCGGTALLGGFRQRLERRLRVDVRLGHPWARLAQTKDHDRFFHNGREDPRLMMSLATAAGLALWRPIS